jgi:uncharacterized repeat protein (TIGR02543 family)
MNHKNKKINKLKEVLLLCVSVVLMFSCAAKDRISSPTSSNTTTTYTLTVVVNPQGAGSVTISPTSSDGKYAAGTQVTLVATANTGYTFSNWSGDVTGTTNPTTITMNSNKVVVANFTQSGGGGSSGGTTTYYTLTVVVNPQGAGSVTLSPSGGSYIAGTVVTLTATANTGYTFSNWSGDATGTSNPTTITMTSNKSVTANFTQTGGGGATTVIFADSGAIGFVGVYSGGGTQFTIDVDYSVFHEGSFSMRADVTGVTSGWGGWYVEEGGPGGTETADMSAYSNGYLKFWAKSPVVLQVAVLSINQNPDTANSKILLTGSNSYGFVADNEWHEVSIPLSAFKTADPNLDFSRISTYFSVAVIGDTGGAKSFWIDDVRWVSQ